MPYDVVLVWALLKSDVVANQKGNHVGKHMAQPGYPKLFRGGILDRPDYSTTEDGKSAEKDEGRSRLDFHIMIHDDDVVERERQRSNQDR